MGWVSTLDANEETIWIADAHCGDGKRFVVHANEKLTAFLGTRIDGWWTRMACQAKPYMRIRPCLTRQVRMASVKTFIKRI